jgi:tRNA 2-selenouridine synthase SelU
MNLVDVVRFEVTMAVNFLREEGGSKVLRNVSIIATSQHRRTPVIVVFCCLFQEDKAA